MFKEVYPLLISGWNISTDFGLEKIYNNMNKIKETNKGLERGVILENHYFENYQIIREILNLLNIEVLEMRNIKKRGFSFGVDEKFKVRFPELSKRIKEKIINNFPKKENLLITSSAYDFKNFKDNHPRDISKLILERIKNVK
jgi:hypothetical protein